MPEEWTCECAWTSDWYLSSFRSAAPSAAALAIDDVAWMYDSAKVSVTVTSQVVYIFKPAMGTHLIMGCYYYHYYYYYLNYPRYLESRRLKSYSKNGWNRHLSGSHMIIIITIITIIIIIIIIMFWLIT